jgi:hypothetical protein
VLLKNVRTPKIKIWPGGSQCNVLELEMDLIPQADSHLIKHTERTPLTYHSYKLFVGESFNESSHVYLYRTAGSKRQYQLEITSINLERNRIMSRIKSCTTVP